MTQQLVYTLDDLAALPPGTVVRAHRNLSGITDEAQILVRQPDGWFGAWGYDIDADPSLVIPCTVLARGAS